MAKADDIITSMGGLNTNGNPLEVGQTASVAVADNCVLKRDGVLERRSGFANFSTGLPAYKPAQAFTSGGVLYLQHDDGLWYYDTTNSIWARVSVTSQALAGQIYGIFVNSAYAYFTESGRNAVKRLSLTTGLVDIFVGSSSASGTTDATGTAARFNSPIGIWGDATNLYVCDSGNHTIRQAVLSSGVVTTIAGTAGAAGTTDATGATARFTTPRGMVGYGSALYITHNVGVAVRKITLPGAVVTTLASSGLTKSDCIATDGTSLFLADDTDSVIRKMVIAGGTLSVVAGTSGATGSADGTGAAARFNRPNGLWSDGTNLYVADLTNNTIRAIVISSGVVTTPFGTAGASGSIDGVGTSARFNGPYAGLFGVSSKLFIGDYTNFTLRSAYLPAGTVYTAIGLALTQATAVFASAVSGMMYGPTASRRNRSAEYNGNTFVTSISGARKLTSSTASITDAGIPKALDISLTVTGATGFLTKGNNCAYRLVWGIRDANNNVVTGSPSQRSLVQAAAGGNATTNIVVTSYIPGGITTSHFYQVYRSTQTALATDPGDELSLAYESNPTQTDLNNGYIAFTDLATDAFLGAALYTNATQQGIAQANDQPPLSTDLTLYKDTMIYANCMQRQTKQFNVIGTGSFTSGVSTITIGGVTYTAVLETVTPAIGLDAATDAPTLEVITTGTFVYWSGVAGAVYGTVAQNIDSTAKSLVRVINRYAANSTYYAYYVSTATGVPGQIEIRERAVGGSAITFTVNSTATGTMFSPNIPTSGTTFSSNNGQVKNGIYCSKAGQPEHVPIANFFAVGARTEEIQRVVALRDSVIIVKDNSIWRLVGDSISNFVVTRLDNTVSVVGRDSVSLLNNTVFALTNQGVVGITDAGVQIMSRSIENRLLADMRPYIGVSTAHTSFIGQGHEADRTYVLSAITSTLVDDAGVQVAWVYNAFTRGWTRWLINANCMTVLNDRLYYGLNNANGHVLKQRSGYGDSYTTSNYEYSDETATAVVSSINTSALTAVVTFTAGVNYGSYTYAPTFGVGWVIVQGSSQFLVTAWNAGTTTATLTSVTGMTAISSTCYRPIDVSVQISPRYSGNPFDLKQWAEFLASIDSQNTYLITTSFASESDTTADPVNFTYSSTVPSVAILTNDYATTNGSCLSGKLIRTYVPATKAFGAQLSVLLNNKVALARFSLNGIGLTVRSAASSKVTK